MGEDRKRLVFAPFLGRRAPVATKMGACGLASIARCLAIDMSRVRANGIEMDHLAGIRLRSTMLQCSMVRREFSAAVCL